MREFSSLDSYFKHAAKFTAPSQKRKKRLQISKAYHYYLWSQLPLQKASTYTQKFWGTVPQRLKSNSQLPFFCIHLHLVATHKASSAKQLTTSTGVEGDGLRAVPRASHFPGKPSLYFPECLVVIPDTARAGNSLV